VEFGGRSEELRNESGEGEDLDENGKMGLMRQICGYGFVFTYRQ